MSDFFSARRITGAVLALTAIAVSVLLTWRYFPLEPDVANSPLVWRGFLNEGFSVFRDWRPTPDNWYFTVYPVNFLFFLLTGQDGRLPLIISTALFISLSAIIACAMLNQSGKKPVSFLALLALTCLPAFVLREGFASHPFSHYSTSFFGVVALALVFYNLHRQALWIALLYSLLSFFASVADPWFLATYYLPLLLSLIYLSGKKQVAKHHLLLYLITFVLSFTHAPQRWFGLPNQAFTIQPLSQWWMNAQWVWQVLGKSLNLFFIDNALTQGLSLLVWLCVLIYAFTVAIKASWQARLIALCSLFSIAAIIASFIISYDMPESNSARFFGNVIFFSILLTSLAAMIQRNRLLIVCLLLFPASSLYSYSQSQQPLVNQQPLADEYIAFLQRHQLYYGYSDFWLQANIVNWFSQGKIHITAVWFDPENYHIRFDVVRGQTMASWLTPEFINAAPARQFVAIPAVADSHPHSQANQQLAAIKTQLGQPDEILIFHQRTLFVYNKNIALLAH
ncbi:hypothetical protein BL250_06925 [Erwinia sp. OLTSP20]|nr:hypothetical protein [Erwinia sp. OLCASP19]PIJ50866.1 hypothetical protein BV501_06655 [Erwinia sp. OAMSP11]PIJ73252.1 hypothetical protein BK416_07320 [Erwinia sp. OLSSP12]PIJ85418.1 hypothetical protein BLD46_06220 [Erwinia sp. OLMTSP26]PIJ87115.1 hypothetical protein BLD49_06875 [Erwinia sp. OLMDSP33]PIJ90022.1 hypothetical protein BL249_14145 [Erwinia sp. OLFS4]PIJ93238.1 hypothetical protein BL250_06925 [Erwinia sp. OLTSP20]